MTVLLDGHSLRIRDVVLLATSPHNRIELSPKAQQAVQRSRAIVENYIASDEPIYGITTGFGEFANVRISPQDLEQLQENLIFSHSAGTGSWLPREIVRAMLILRINALAKGYSGIRLETLNTLVQMVNADIIPAVPEQGSVGSSGDLVQLSHIALAALGKGRILLRNGEAQPSDAILRQHGITPVRLQAKEGLAMINGTQMMCAFGTLSIDKALRLAYLADVAGALSTEALRGTDTAFDERIHALRGFAGQRESARMLRALMQGSQIRESHRDRTVDNRVQDAYSIRCMPQVHGASRDALQYVASVIQTEINAATDNPLIFPADVPLGGIHLEGGNFHGQPVALALDFLAIACAELANISERRIERLVNGSLSGLPRFLAPHGGVHSGLMIAQYTAASIISENKVLCHPASVDSIPTSANQEDHNSMGSIAAQKAWRVVHNLERVLAIEFLCATQGLDFLLPLRSSEPLEAVRTAIRSVVPFMESDRVVYDDIEAIRQLLEQGTIEQIVHRYYPYDYLLSSDTSY
ncbi:MAG: histidine ammonia-lyase [Bacteroidota bacterium]|nr:histidine ammonia-lyase [Candidatus Kapabacteria bacterium]MDW8219887.1 histidine ammonia-lyase [Bacteroidota bacterium]